ncbi:MAG: hypothetical protein E7195_06560 [Peptococcaceae bacterium]|nr:hypothetical protein [Peptococcaceae bacterium]
MQKSGLLKIKTAKLLNSVKTICREIGYKCTHTVKICVKNTLSKMKNFIKSELDAMVNNTRDFGKCFSPKKLTFCILLLCAHMATVVSGDFYSQEKVILAQRMHDYFPIVVVYTLLLIDSAKSRKINGYISLSINFIIWLISLLAMPLNWMDFIEESGIWLTLMAILIVSKYFCVKRM